jgi:hypothetical protein
LKEQNQNSFQKYFLNFKERGTQRRAFAGRMSCVERRWTENREFESKDKKKERWEVEEKEGELCGEEKKKERKRKKGCEEEGKETKESQKEQVDRRTHRKLQEKNYPSISKTTSSISQ